MLVLTLWPAAPARAQGFPFQESRLNGAAILLRHPGVQAQLKVSKEQNDKVRQVSDNVRKKYEAEFEKMEKMATPDERTLFKRNLSQRIISDVTKELPSILTPEQMKRLQQISLQQSGLQAFDEKMVRDKLNLTKEQQEKIQKIKEDTKEEYFAIRKDANMNFEVSRKKDHEFKQKNLQAALQLLNDEQNRQWRELVGEPFDFVGANGLKPADPAAPEKPKQAAPAQGVKEDLSWVSQRVEEIQPAPDERKIDLIGWCPGILPALELAKKHNRPLLVHTYNDGRICNGRS
jgi:hypothetical protein